MTDQQRSICDDPQGHYRDAVCQLIAQELDSSESRWDEIRQGLIAAVAATDVTRRLRAGFIADSDDPFEEVIPVLCHYISHRIAEQLKGAIHDSMHVCVGRAETQRLGRDFLKFLDDYQPAPSPVDDSQAGPSA